MLYFRATFHLSSYCAYLTLILHKTCFELFILLLKGLWEKLSCGDLIASSLYSYYDLIHPIKYHSNMIVNVGFIYSKSWDNTILLSVPHDLKAYTHDLLLYHFYIMYFSNKNHRWVALKMLISAMYLILGWPLI